jgi:D-arabinose 1-dehydrogenase-like Zn-dependent alcohol dehydrogenase
MKAFFITAPGQWRVGEIEIPKPGPEEVLLRTRIVGMCGSDLNTFRGYNPLVTYPRIPGHEIAATVEAVGAGVPSEFRPGVDVTVSLALRPARRSHTA